MKKLLLLAIMALSGLSAFAYDAEIDGICYTFSSDEAIVTYASENYNSYSGTVVIPPSVTHGGKTYSVTSIGEAAFYNCVGLTSIAIPNSVTNIGDHAFYGCIGLASITIPESVTSIGRGAFSGCTGLTSITIPNSVTSIGDGAFYNCSSLRFINIPESVTSIGDKVFQDCSNLSSVIINCPIDGSWFSHKSSIVEIILGKNVTNIEENAFSKCSGLTSVTIGSSVTTIGDDAFADCYRLTTIYCLNPVPPTCAGLRTFECSTNDVRDKYDIYNYATFHVPMGSKEAYSSAYEWRYFNKIKEDMDMNGQMYYTTLSVNQAGDGYVKHYVKVDEPYTLFIGSEVGMRINTVLFNGEDVTDRLVDGYYTTPVITRPSKIVVSFEQDPDGISYVPADDNLHVYGIEGSLYVSGLEEPQRISVYTLDGKLTSTQTIESDTKLKLNVGVYVVKVGERTFKVSL